jgi:Ca-activated chloride channel family protein
VTDVAFLHSLWLLGLALLPPLALWRWWTLRRGVRALPFPLTELAFRLRKPSRIYPWVSPILALLGLAALLVGLARPVRTLGQTRYSTEGVAILVCMDISGSMLALDFQPSNRVDVAKVVVADFIKKRPEDRLGLVTFAALPMLRCPLTSDHGTLLNLVRDVRTVTRTEIDGTAIGDALIAAGKRLIKAPEASRVVILVTDGENNRGQIDPQQAAELLAGQRIRVHVVGIGSEGTVPYPVPEANGRVTLQFVKIGFNEESLKAIASSTGGLYYNATDSKGLERVFDAIDKLERTKVTATGYVRREELFLFPLGAGCLALCLLLLWRAGPGRATP